MEKLIKTLTHLVKNTLRRQIMPAVLDEECKNPETGGPPREKKHFLSSNILRFSHTKKRTRKHLPFVFDEILQSACLFQGSM